MFFIYGKPNCVECDKAKNMLAAYDKVYVYVDIMQNKAAFDKINAMNVKSLPQVFFYDDSVEHLIGNVASLREYLLKDE